MELLLETAVTLIKSAALWIAVKGTGKGQKTASPNLPFKLFIMVSLLAVATIPWFSFGGSTNEDVGLPNWVLYSILMTVIFPIVVSFAIGRYWSEMAEGPDDESSQEEDV